MKIWCYFLHVSDQGDFYLFLLPLKKKYSKCLSNNIYNSENGLVCYLSHLLGENQTKPKQTKSYNFLLVSYGKIDCKIEINYFIEETITGGGIQVSVQF